MEKSGLTRQLGAHSGQILFWSMPAARIALVILAYAHFSSSPTILNQTMMICWAAWAFITMVAAFFGQPLVRKTLKLFWVGDISMAILAIIFLPDMEAASFAFAICVVCSARICFAQTFPQLLTLGLPVVIWIFKTTIFEQIYSHFLGTNGSWYPEITISLILLTMGMVTLMAIRRGQWEKFRYINAEVKGQMPRRAMELNLQGWINSLAELYSPNKAALALMSPFNKSAFQCVQHHLPQVKSQSMSDDVMAAINSLPPGCCTIDCDLNQCVPIGEKPRLLLESEKPLASFLKRCDIAVAFVQQIHIDRLEGAVICAVQSKVGPALLAEAVILSRTITDIAEFLNRKAAAERSFIADAHDVARRDLHDGVLQTLAALRMRLATIARRREQSDDMMRTDIKKTVDIITLEQTRLRGLLETNTLSNGSVNLVTRLDVCLRAIALQWDISITLKAEDPAVPMDHKSALNIENLLREVMANAARHTASQSLTVSLSLKHDALMIAVNDAMRAKQKGGSERMASLPLQSSSMRQRLRIANADAYVENLDQGALLSIRIPMEQIDDA